VKICEFVNTREVRIINLFLCSSEPIVSPYSRRTLKPFIRRDFDTEPAKLKILRAIQARSIALDGSEARSRLAREACGLVREDIEARGLARVEIEARGLAQEGGFAREDIEARGLARVGIEARGLARDGIEARDLARDGIEARDLARDGIEARDLARVGIEARDLARVGIEARDLAHEGGPALDDIKARGLARVGFEARDLAREDMEARGFAREESVIILEQHPLDYCYVQPAHIPAVNRLASRLFWPGKYCRETNLSIILGTNLGVSTFKKLFLKCRIM
jgi:hypothetical protein